MDYWVLTDPLGDTPDEPIVLLQVDGPFIKVWAPHQNAWVDAPSYFDAIYGDDPGAVKVDEQQAAQYRADGVGLEPDKFDAMLAYQDTYRKSLAEPATDG